MRHVKHIVTRGAAVAMLTAGLAGPAAAQSGGVLPARTRDSVSVRIISPTRALLDSIAVLWRAWLSEPYGSAGWESLRKRIDSLQLPLMSPRITFEQKLSGESVMPKGYIGIVAPGRNIINAAGQFVLYYDYPTIISVDPDSPAQHAGIVPGDVLLAYDGQDVRGRQFNLTRMLLPEKKLAVLVKHEGENKEFALTVAKATERIQLRRHDLGDVPEGDLQLNIIRSEGAARAAVAGMAARGGSGQAGAVTMMVPGGNLFFMTANSAFGATLSTVGPELAKTLKLETGVLVNDVPEESLAFKGGLRTGDVIVNAGGESIASVRALQETIMVAKRGAERGLTLQVIREKQPKKITVNW